MTVPDGAIDIHVHAGPSFFNRKFDAIELATVYADTGMGGFVLKSHFGDTLKPARMANQRASDIDVYSSVTLNSFVGGFNPTAVEFGLENGAKVIWLPTFSAKNFDISNMSRKFPFSKQSLSVTDNEGNIREEVREILSILADSANHVALGNGHISHEESFAVLDVMDEMGIDLPYLITHADFDFMGLSIKDQIDLADRGAIIEKCYLPILHSDVELAEVADSIRKIGPDSCVLSTDHGQVDNDTPPDAYATFVNRLLNAGLDKSKIASMTVNTPNQLLGLNNDN